MGRLWGENACSSCSVGPLRPGGALLLLLAKAGKKASSVYEYDAFYQCLKHGINGHNDGMPNLADALGQVGRPGRPTPRPPVLACVIV